MAQHFNHAVEADDVLRLVGRGLTNQQIADRLNAREPQVRNRVIGLLRRFNVQNRVQLALAYHDIEFEKVEA